MSINVLIIGENLLAEEIAKTSVHFQWPHTLIALTTQATRGLKILARGWPDLVLLSPDFSDMLPSVAFKSLRQSSDVPLIVLGFPECSLDAVTALNLGADDYVQLPCDLSELSVRIWSLIRRVSDYRPLLSGPFSVDIVTDQAFLDGQRLRLNSAELRLLYLLVKNRGGVVSHEILEHALGIDDSWECHQKLLTNMRSLNRKLKLRAGAARGLVNVRDQGYSLDLPSPDSAQPVVPELVASR